MSHSEKVKGRLRFVFNVVQHFTEHLKHASAITAASKSSMKLLSSATANHHLCSSGERKGEQR